MKLHDILKEGNLIKRKNWDFYLTVCEGNLKISNCVLNYTTNVKDITADDWEIKEDSKKLVLNCRSNVEDERLIIEKIHSHELGFSINSSFGELIYLEESDIGKILDFLYKNTKIGKSRVVPF